MFETKEPKILFFTKEFELSLEEKEILLDLDFIPQMRNSMFAQEFEECDGVMGAVPAAFRYFPQGFRLNGIDVGGKPIPDGEAVYKRLKDARQAHLAELRAQVDARRAEDEAKAKAKADFEAKAAQGGAQAGGTPTQPWGGFGSPTPTPAK